MRGGQGPDAEAAGEGARTARQPTTASQSYDYLTVPRATVNWLPGLGHSPLIESPPRTAAQLLPFTTARST
ncbi:hypothetical protein [Streptomyces sp. NPDC008139]|uniref:hypothetical protein n=1 Tax=Streptomyces sp. NPDC008139 TaxID=3364814 RepID=UPI0036E4479F